MQQYDEAVEYIFHIPRYQKKTDQKGIRHLLHILKDPHLDFPVIHVTGTNGKGSVCAFLNQIGMDKGLKMGMFTSPHLVDVRERFQVDSQLMSHETFVQCFDLVLQATKQLEEDGYRPATFFEFVFAMAMVYFSREKVDYAIVEAGMGGRSDTTNVVTPVISVISSVGLDHTAILGDTLEKIAYEKAGIIKKDVPAVVNCRSNPELKSIFWNYSREIGTICHFTDEYDVRILKNSLQGIDFSVNCEYDNEDDFHIGMCGNFQVENAVTAVMAVRLLWDCSFTSLRKSIAKTFWPGRMQQILPRFYVDGAHNDQAMIQFVSSVNTYFPNEKKILLYAVASDKDNCSMVKELDKLSFHTVIVTELQNGRKTDCHLVAEMMRQEWQSTGRDIIVEKDLFQAVDRAVTMQAKEDYVFCVGSLYLAGAVIGRYK